MTKEINCVWIGNQLSIMEKLSLALAVKSGYNVILWSYCTFDDLPIGVTHKIIDKERLRIRYINSYKIFIIIISRKCI
jgi:hypothetical protein